MVIKGEITKPKWEKAKNCYSALIYNVFMIAFSNRKYKCFYTTPIFVKSIFSCVHLKKKNHIVQSEANEPQ